MAILWRLNWWTDNSQAKQTDAKQFKKDKPFQIILYPKASKADQTKRNSFLNTIVALSNEKKREKENLIKTKYDRAFYSTLYHSLLFNKAKCYFILLAKMSINNF